MQGAEYACSALTVEDLVEMTDPAHVIRADVIRDLLLGRHGELDPRGVRVSGARIVDRLDLDHVTAAAGVELLGCVITEPITAEYAVLPRLNLRGSRTTALHADGLRITGELILERVRARWDGDKGTIRLILAHIGGQLDLSDAEITNTGGAAVLADRLHVEADVFLRRTHASGAGTIGAARLVNARIGGQLECSDTRTINTTGPAVLADSIRVGNNLSLIDVQAAGSGDLGTVRLVNARVGGQLQWSGGKVVNTSGPALIADGIHVDTSMAIRDLNASGSDAKGTVQLPAARVDGQIGWPTGSWPRVPPAPW
ncbi:hypothetical protein B0I31_10288 [Saccharothrix carnea]|uniref:Uncharacterized protein n=1 Tax=Saccharothrix carnea TaxID=1280637 RepID=A0A2P8IF65_SACCR|nr:hypothetical protein B0I31_10288 [Saccharothrix carnea]